MHPLDTVDQLVKALGALQPIKQEYQHKLDKKFRLEFNFNSNHLEGNTLTYNETELLLMFDDTKGNHQMREYEEMKAHDVAYHLINEWAKESERPLTEQAIKNLNETILVRPFWKEAITQDGQNTRRKIQIGNYKEFPNSVRLQNGEIFNYASPAETPILMNELMTWYRTDEKSLHPVALAAMLHYKFVRIHPFDDGNGRIARLLMNYILIKNNLPPVVIKSKEKSKYLKALHFADIGNFEAFIEYIAEQVIWSLEMYIKGAKGESIDEPGDLDKKLSLFEQTISKKEDFVTIKKSIEIQEKLCTNVFIPLINEIGIHTNKLEKYFFNCYYQLEPRSVFNKSKIYSLPGIIKTFMQYSKDIGYDTLYILYSLDQFKREKNQFDIELLLTVELEEFKYIVTAEFGDGGSLDAFGKLAKLSLGEKKINKKYTLLEGYYHTFPLKNKIENIAEQVANDLFSLVENEALKN